MMLIAIMIAVIISIYVHREMKFRKLSLYELIDLKRRHKRAYNRLSEKQTKSYTGRLLNKTIIKIEKRINTIQKNVQ